MFTIFCGSTLLANLFYKWNGEICMTMVVNKVHKALGTKVLTCYLGRLADWLTGWLADWLTGWLADWLTGWLADWLTGWLADWLTGWLADWLTGWLADWLTGWLADWLTGWLADWMYVCNELRWKKCRKKQVKGRGRDGKTKRARWRDRQKDTN